MTIYLLIIIYLIFISLGLPDSIIGSIWPFLSEQFLVSADYQGIVTITISLCTIISSFLTSKLVKLFKAKYVVMFSILLTAIGIFCFGLSNQFYLLILSCIPFGLGAGAIDTTLNNYVAIHYKAMHMNFLHAFWGVGTIISPLILANFLTSENYRIGIYILAIIQVVIFLIVLANIWVWKKAEIKFKLREEKIIKKEEDTVDISFFNTFKIKGVAFAIIGFFSYIAVESLMGFWFSSYISYGLQDKISISASDIANYVSLFYIGITFGRLIGGLLSIKLTDKVRLRIGEGVILIGLIFFITTSFASITDFNYLNFILPFCACIIGIGCGPVYPAIIHDTPSRFTVALSQNVMSIQVGCAYIANISVAPLFGLIGENWTFLSLPYFILFFLILLIFGNEVTYIKTKNKAKLYSKIKSN